jgi:hypothetical protein
MTGTTTTTTIWEIASTPSGFEILRDGVTLCAIDGDIQTARLRLDELLSSSASAASEIARGVSPARR